MRDYNLIAVPQDNNAKKKSTERRSGHAIHPLDHPDPAIRRRKRQIWEFNST
jgi:hypothetical protein